MQVGELWWAGKEEALSTKLDKMAPSCLSLDNILDEATVKTSEFRDGVGFKASVFKRDPVELQLNLYLQWKLGMESSIAATESTQRAQAAVEKLRLSLVDFRGTIKNDLSSMKAASERVQSEVLQMRDRYKQAQDLLISPEFMKAVENAERMAAALDSIQKLTETKISVAVFGTSGDTKK